MGFSVNLYLDGSISEKRIREIENSADRKLQKDVRELIEEKPLQIFLYLREKGKHALKKYVERKVTQKQWDNQKQRVNPKYYKGGSIEFNTYLSNVVTILARIYFRGFCQRTMGSECTARGVGVP